MNDLKETAAHWSISLDCECPYCGNEINLIDYYSENIGEPLERDDELNLEVFCTECQKDFIVKSTHY